MSCSTPTPSLLSLPLELHGFIVPYRVNLDVPISELVDGFDRRSLKEVRALSQTCRQLRNVYLPLLWAKVELKSVKQLGVLHGLLKALPHLVVHIKSFSFRWTMGGDCRPWRLAAFASEEGSTLDLAFTDRLELFERLYRLDGADSEILSLGMDGDDTEVRCNGKVCSPPGRHDERIVCESYPWTCGAGGRGPDGKGEDPVIKNAAEFNQYITEVVGMLPFLETFCWRVHVTPMPRGVFDALTRLASLEQLFLLFTTHRSNLSDLPFWELAGKLKTLIICHEDPVLEAETPFVEYQTADDEANFSTTEGEPWILSRYKQRYFNGDTRALESEAAREALHVSAGYRTIIAAARGGRLKRLYPGQDGGLNPFNVRALLPYWVQIEDWGATGSDVEDWMTTAVLLRPFLAHASLRLDWLASTPSEDPSQSRLLTLQDLHALQAYFADEEPEWHEYSDYAPVVDHHLRWMVEDAELGQRVLDVWSGIVKEGKADLVKCRCNRCYSDDVDNSDDGSEDSEEDGSDVVLVFEEGADGSQDG